MRRLAALVLALFVALAVAVGGPAGLSVSLAQPAAQARQVKVITGMGIVKDLVEQVGRDRVEVVSVVPAGADPHTYQPTPRDIQSMQGARLAVWNGLGLDETASDLVAEQSLPDLTTVVLSAGITPMAGDEHDDEDGEAHAAGHEDDHADEDDHGHGHAHAAGNPHLWLDPGYAVHYVEAIRDALIEVDPAGADQYRANATAYIGEINALDAWAQTEVAKIPAERRKLVTFHDAFPYFAQHYGLELIGVVLKSPGREPSAQEVAALVTEMKAHNIPVVFAEPQFNARILDLAARDAGVQVKRLYSDAFDTQVTTYLDLMRFNITSVVEGLS
jgi:zinc/manganese transport system substrate-binding protein/manganese/iron transport system substrate-binding protein